MHSDFERRLWLFYRNVCVTIENLFIPVVTRENLTIPQARILLFIHEATAATVGEVSSAIRMNGGNCSTMCKKLEARGYLQRTRSREDERIVWLKLTEQGKATLERIYQTVYEAQKPLLEELSEKDSQQIMEELDQLEQFFGRMATGTKIMAKER